MSEKDFMVGVTGVPNVGNITKKPCYLVKLDGAKKVQFFISIDKPDLLNGFIQSKGFYSDEQEDVIYKSFANLLAVAKAQELIVDMMFPWHKIHSIRSLVFSANKPATLIR
jgi:hypothetical protein